jgi:molybdopterin molybdotransferase
VYDTVKEVLAAEEGVEFVRVAMRPGMPQGSGVVGRGRTPLVTLPGNPVSSFVSFHVFVLPALRRLAGMDADADGSFDAVAAQDWPTAPAKVEATRVVEEADGRVRPSGRQGSHVLGALAGATALALVPADVDRVQTGDRVRCIPLLGQDARRGC